MTVVEIELERVAHGGSVVGRVGEKVVFVTGGLPGERVRAEITSTSKRFERARVVEVLEPAAGRVEPPCPIALECGGCDWQHASTETQLDLKTAVVAELLQRMAGIEWEGRVQSVGAPEGSRTRMRYGVAPDGAVGLRGRRSNEIVPLPAQGCMVAAPGPDVAGLRRFAAGARELEVVNADGAVTVLADGRLKQGGRNVIQHVHGRDYTVSAAGFWQVHPRAAEVLTTAVLEGLVPQPGESALDLYCGVGLFAGSLVDAGCDVLGIELSRDAIAHARRNVPEAEFIAAPLAKALDRFPERADLVVLDPPRKGAGAEVVARVAALDARAIAYVACDPAALARDLATFTELGYSPVFIDAWDLFPMTHHVECVAILQR
ncbi:class I SAM-dependent RNA methyltransferase [Tessaracoccus terricola]